ncbi:MAG: CPBP family intramembrane metalloprotease [Puniceicoccales bacterium]|jgi:membrane protease YdiL (CAAX protease family)|nr:CPBP family intramembrane metalloprotease [Puniceicoccales bacterium]
MKNERPDGSAENWNGVVRFLVFYLGILLLAAILTPIMFFSVKYCAERFSVEIFHHFIGKGFGKFFDRAKLISAIILLFPLVKISGIRSAKDIWLEKFSKRQFFLIFASGFIFTHLVYGWLMCANHFSAEAVPVKIYFSNLGKFAVAATGVGFLEELLFRGVIFRLFSESLGRISAIVLASLFFAYCHGGVGESAKINTDSATIFSGFSCIIPSLLSICRNFNLLSFLNLTMFGIFLSVLLVDLKSIFAPIAFHIGVVFAVMNVRSFIKIAAIGVLDTRLTFVLIGTLIIFISWRIKTHSTRAMM